jgi:hypothetical protein
MILVTGATGFVGSALIRSLNLLGKPIRLLLRPSPKSPRIPRGVKVEVAVCSLNDDRGLMAAMRDVDVIYHLAGTERAGSQADLNGVDIDGTAILADAAAQSGVERFFFLSHIGADRASAFPVMKAKGIAEGLIKKSGVTYTICGIRPGGSIYYCDRSVNESISLLFLHARRWTGKSPTALDRRSGDLPDLGAGGAKNEESNNPHRGL